ncbi:MAG: type secretion protein DotU [Chromatiaceae bacterium]|nr:type secretion protein DotU [Chromatiaceae bacterium]
MTEDDPFLQLDGGPTVIRPMPGGRRPPGAAPAPQASRPPPDVRAAPGGPLPGAVTDNPLVACATDLLTVAAQLRGSASHPDPEGLREQLIGQIRAFEQCARGKGLTDPVVLPARYVLCALVDESVLDTPWGSQSVWAKRGLLISLHNEAWGGEKFFDALERLLAFPSGNLHLLELMYLCLALGFEGRYRVRDAGREQLERVRENLFQTIRSQRGDPERELSPHWRGIREQRDPLIHQLPLWVFIGLAALVLLGFFAAFTFALSRDSDPVFLSLSALDKRLPPMPERQTTPIPQPEPPPPAASIEPPVPVITLRTLLADDIAANRVEVQDRPDGQTVIIRGDGLFASASATLQPAFVPVVRRIGEALGQLPGRVLVTGHSDSAPIKTLRFPSNWHLSQARAESVGTMLGEVTGEPRRFTAEGRADTELRVPDNPRDARNRRVEITLAPVRSATTAGASGS